MYLGLMTIMGPDKLCGIDRIAFDYNTVLQNDKELFKYLYSVNPTLNISKDSSYLKEQYEKEQHSLPELARFLAYEQVMMGTLLNEFNKHIGKYEKEGRIYSCLRRMLHYLRTFSESIDARASYTLYHNELFPQKHIDEAMDILKGIPCFIPENTSSFNEYMFMHSPMFSVQPATGTHEDTDPHIGRNIQNTGIHENPEETAPEYQPHMDDADQHSQEVQTSSPGERQYTQSHQQSAPQAGRKHYTVFVSSTFEDMKDIRKAVLERLYSTEDFMPIGMENFMASDSSQLDYIRDRLNDTDIYVLLLGGRYGTLTPHGDKSYTHKEYEMSKANPNVRVLSFVCSNPGDLTEQKRWRDDAERDKLMKFTAEVKNNTMVKFWNVGTSPEEIAGDVLQSVVREKETESLRGWIRGE